MPLLGTLARVLKWPCQAPRGRGGPEASRARPQRTLWDMGESLDLLLHLMGSLWRLKQVVLNLVCSLKGWLWIPGRERKKGVKSGIVYTSRRPRTHQVTQEDSLSWVVGLHGNRGEGRSRCVLEVVSAGLAEGGWGREEKSKTTSGWTGRMVKTPLIYRFCNFMIVFNHLHLPYIIFVSLSSCENLK